MVTPASNLCINSFLNSRGGSVSCRCRILGEGAWCKVSKFQSFKVATFQSFKSFKVSRFHFKVSQNPALIAHGSWLIAHASWLMAHGSSQLALAAYDLPESCTACCATTFISFSSDEKRCMIS